MEAHAEIFVGRVEAAAAVAAPATRAVLGLQEFPRAGTPRSDVFEAAFRRSFGSTNFKGSGADGKLVVGDTFKPSGLETIMFDFGDGSMLTPMMFTVQAYSLSEDWVQGISTF